MEYYSGTREFQTTRGTEYLTHDELMTARWRSQMASGEPGISSTPPAPYPLTAAARAAEGVAAAAATAAAAADAIIVAAAIRQREREWHDAGGRRILAVHAATTPAQAQEAAVTQSITAAPAPHSSPITEAQRGLGVSLEGTKAFLLDNPLAIVALAITFILLLRR